MSKNPAWNAYNEKHREINEAYETEAKPLRAKVMQEISATEKKYDDQIQPLILEKNALVSKLRSVFTDKVRELEEKRKKALKVAHEVLQSEIASFAQQKKAEKTAVPA